jgi:hypothetical protein
MWFLRFLELNLNDEDRARALMVVESKIRRATKDIILTVKENFVKNE